MLALGACGRDRDAQISSHDASASSYRGSDLLVLRLARGGGEARVYGYPRVDSLIWTSQDRVPALDHVLGFDPDAGTVAFVDAKGRAGWLDLRQGAMTIASREKIAAPISIDGSAIFGVSPAGAVVRYTPSETWTLKTPRAAQAPFPQGDGSVVVLAGGPGGAVAWRARPPETDLTDTVDLPRVQRTLRTQLGDRIYLVADGKLVGLRTRTMEQLPAIDMERAVAALVATPSGDRLFVADSSNELAVVDRYRERVTSTVTLPDAAADLRMDPFGRYLLVRAVTGERAWVVAVGTGRVVGTVGTAWRDDLPFVAPDGGVVIAQGKDVVVLDGETLKGRARVTGGATDFWYSFVWAGFRPRAASLDESPPLPAPVADTAVVATDSAAGPPPVDSSQARPSGGFTVSFAALLAEDKARELAAQIRVGGDNARVVTSDREGTTIYRVILGPYPTREQAERIGKESGQSYWVYEGAP